MRMILPSRDAMARMGWAYQVQWTEEGRPCFLRFKSGEDADHCAEILRQSGANPYIIDLVEALQLH